MDAVPTPEGVWGQGRPCRSRPLKALPPVDPVDRQEAADGQSADGSGSLQLPLLFLQGRPRPAACGDHPWPPTTLGSHKRCANNRGQVTAAVCVLGRSVTVRLSWTWNDRQIHTEAR
jgi:hypothetical protein